MSEPLFDESELWKPVPDLFGLSKFVKRPTPLKIMEDGVFFPGGRFIGKEAVNELTIFFNTGRFGGGRPQAGGISLSTWVEVKDKDGNRHEYILNASLSPYAAVEPSIEISDTFSKFISAMKAIGFNVAKLKWASPHDYGFVFIPQSDDISFHQLELVDKEGEIPVVDRKNESAKKVSNIIVFLSGVILLIIAGIVSWWKITGMGGFGMTVVAAIVELMIIALLYRSVKQRMSTPGGRVEAFGRGQLP